jgi:hypothetical protein
VSRDVRRLQSAICATSVCRQIGGTSRGNSGRPAKFLWQLVNGTGDPLGLVVLAAVVIGLKVMWRVFIRRRLNAYATRGISSGAA